jgi:hypothetical protein
MFRLFRLNKLLREVDDRLVIVERQLKTLEMEWSDTYDRLRKTMSRVVKRAEREAVAAEEEPLQAEGTVLAGGLTTRQRLIQSQIIARRNRGGDDGLLPR